MAVSAVFLNIPSKLQNQHHFYTTDFCQNCSLEGRFRKTAKTAFYGPFRPKFYFKDPTYYWILHGKTLSKFLKIFVFIICESAEIYPNFKAQFLSLWGLFQKAAGSWWRPNLLAFKWCTPTWIPRIPIGPFRASKGGHFFAFFGHFSKILKKIFFFVFVFRKGPWVPSKGQKKFGPAVIFVGNMANSKIRPFGASLRGGFFKMAISRPRSKISKNYLIRASSGSRGPPLGHKKHQKSKTHMCDF